MIGRILTTALFVSLSGRALAQDLSLQTTLDGAGSTTGVMFDASALDPAGLFLNKLKVRCTNQGQQGNIRVWTRPGSFVGHETSSSGWNLASFGSFYCGGPGVLSAVAPLNYIPLPANQTTGIYIELTGGDFTLTYTPIPPAAPEYADAHLRITGGAAKIGNGFPAAVIPLSMWNGAITYSIGQRGCYANCDDSTTAPILNANDFQCYLNTFAIGFDSYANCDRSTAAPIFNANDFQCFLNSYAVGCT